MTYHPVKLPEGTTSLSHSRRTNYAVCPRLYYFKYELGLRPIDTPAPLRMGAIMADALEHLDAEVAHQQYAELIAEAMDQQRVDLVSILMDEQAVVTVAAAEKLKRAEMKIPGLEQEVVFVGKSVNGMTDNGRFDGIVPDYQGGVLIVERKFKTYFSQKWAEELLMDDQVTGYVHNAMLKYDVPIDKVFVQYEVDWKPRTRRGKNDTAESYRKRMTDALVAKHDDHHTILLPANEVLQRNAQQLSDFQDRFERMTTDILRERELATEGNVEAWKQHPHSCFRFNSPCPMIKLCTAGTRDQFLGAMKGNFTTPDQRAEAKRLLDAVAVED